MWSAWAPPRACPRARSRATCSSTALLSHGDTKHPMFFPCSPEECFSMAMEAFDFAEHFQTPVFVMTDLDLGMNNWMADPFPYPAKPIAARQGAERRGSDEAGRLRALQRCGRRRRGLSHAARHRSSRGCLFHARQRPQREGAVHRARRRLHPQHGPPGAQVRNHAAARARAGR